MNYIDELYLRINQAYEALESAGELKAADSVEAAAADAGNDVTKLMAAADYAAWHLDQLQAK